MKQISLKAIEIIENQSNCTIIAGAIIGKGKGKVIDKIEEVFEIEKNKAIELVFLERSVIFSFEYFIMVVVYK